MNSPKLSIITACYNSKNYIERIHKSLCAQEFKDFEWILVDDCSTDDTVSTLKEISSPGSGGIQLYSLPINSGGGVALGVGFERARGEFLIIIDHDDELIADALETIASELHKIDSDPSLVGIFYRRMDPETGKAIGGQLKPGTKFKMSWQSNLKPDITDGTIVLKREVSIKYFNPEYLESICLAGVPLQDMTKKLNLISGSEKPILKYHRDNPHSQTRLPRISRKIVYTYARYIDLYDIYYLARPIHWLRHITAMIKFSMIIYGKPNHHNKYIKSNIIKLLSTIMIPAGLISYALRKEHKIVDYPIYDIKSTKSLKNLRES